jgi:RNA polymerase sigma-70 factor (ECF subfamily)
LLQSLSNIDTALILQVSEGDEYAFRLLFDQYRNKIFSIAWKITGVKSAAEDVVQEVFIKLWMNKEKLTGVENFNAYLNTITRNHILNNLRKVAYEQTFLEDLIREQSVNTKNISDPVLYNELQNLVHRAIQQLSPQQKKVFQLSRTEGLKHAEIAAQLNVSRSTVKDHMVEALRSIKIFLNTHGSLIGLLIFLFIGHLLSALL